VAAVRNGRLVAAAIVTAALACAPSASAFERQWHAGADVGMATLFSGDGSTGIAGGAHLAYGLTDAFNAMLEADVSRHPSLGQTVYSAGIGAGYTIDVIRWVPYVGVLAGGYRFVGPPSSSAFGVQLAAGLDYQFSRNLAAGLQFRFHELLTGDTNSYTTTLLRIEYLWGF
jgi:opacity protein-like surface antigen